MKQNNDTTAQLFIINMSPNITVLDVECNTQEAEE